MAQTASRSPALAAGTGIVSIPRLLPNLWHYRELIGHLMVRGIRGQYKQSLIGYAWIIVNPLLQLFVYFFVFSLLLKVPSQGETPFLVFLMIGLIPWLFFSNCVIAAMDSITGGGNLVTMIYFPREVLTVAAVLTRLVDLAAGSAILIALMMYYGQPITWTFAWVPLILLSQILFTIGLAMPIAALSLFFHDVRFLVGVGLHLWFFITPIMYPLAVIPEKYRLIVYELNPFARFVGAYRWAMLDNVSPPLESLISALAISLGFIVFGYYIFKKMEPGFADRI